jgi:hypothetical protein
MTQPMFSITGELRKVYSEPQTNQETGERTMKHRVQILGEVPIRDSDEFKFDFVTLTIDNPHDYRDLVGEHITVPFGFFAPGKGNVVTFVPKGSKPQVVAGLPA